MNITGSQKKTEKRIIKGVEVKVTVCSPAYSDGYVKSMPELEELDDIYGDSNYGFRVNDFTKGVLKYNRRIEESNDS